MAGDSWPTTTLGELCDPARGITYGIVKVGDFVPGGVPVIRGGDIRESRIVCDDSKRVTESVSNQFQRTILKGGEIVLNLIADPGHSAIVPTELAGHNVSRDVAVIPLRESTDVRFVDFFLKSKIAVDWLTARLQGSVTAKINLGTLRELPVPLPPLAEQKAIAAVLGALDDKIELNRRMNATLEAMARALFQSWFVDFDPVRAKLDNRQPPHLDPATAALFPDSFQESELGHIPKRWSVKSLGEVIELAYGKPLKAEDRKCGPVCVYGANGPVGWHDEKLVSGPGIVVGRKGNPGVVTWTHSDFYPIDTTFYVEPRGDCRSLYFLYYALTLQNLANLSADSAVPGLNRNQAYMSKQVIPTQPVLLAFDSQIAPIFAAIHRNEEQSRTIATLRDAILPKLLSGEMCLSYQRVPASLPTGVHSAVPNH